MNVAQKFVKVKPTVFGESEYGYTLITDLQSVDGTQTASLCKVEATGAYVLAIYGKGAVTFNFKTLKEAKAMVKSLLKKD
jgi:hypothetical protein